jgi:Fur family transcriptional regulator, peroxide stress response regulator
MYAAGDRNARLELKEGLGRMGLRPTRQRELVYEVLVSKPDHPTAEDVFARSREKMSSISLATVYNCLDTLVASGLVRAVHRERQPTRYCANMCEHAHLHDLSDGSVIDIELPSQSVQYLRSLVPPNYAVEGVELNFTGHKKQELEQKDLSTDEKG